MSLKTPVVVHTGIVDGFIRGRSQEKQTIDDDLAVLAIDTHLMNSNAWIMY